MGADWASRYEEADRERLLFKERWEQARNELQRAEQECAVLQSRFGDAATVATADASPTIKDCEAPVTVPAVRPMATTAEAGILQRRSLPARGRQGSLGQGLTAGGLSSQGVNPGFGRRSPEGGGLKSGAVGEMARGRSRSDAAR